ncbi:Sorting nexin-16 [Hondaea fermentalgiana]|uniref:Sorting nexin-16 n=1 Tax=Hondaea fermentalgiana TaxID=2315210 RepID=A0A2R5GEW1_9STRA|nr:Sorting nexin-16 [Hondaea fermentalgiana]|eukprot:GBG29460.1 Sorting nexin-16 [Hondaea fermentalgiana]
MADGKQQFAAEAGSKKKGAMKPAKAAKAMAEDKPKKAAAGGKKKAAPNHGTEFLLRPAQPTDFCGIWRVNNDASDSIDPMLKAMGVGWKIRKIVMMLKVLQHIDVHEENFVVRNISENGEDSTTHMINAGEKLIRTKRGDEVMDTCTFDPEQEFPLRIVAVLPHGKGTTEDLRKMNADGSGFMQHLTYKYPPHINKPDILMKRFFVDASNDPLREHLEASRAKHAPSVLVNTTEDANGKPDGAKSHQGPEAKLQDLATNITAKSLAEPTAQSTELWVASVLAIAVLTCQFFAFDQEQEPREDSQSTLPSPAPLLAGPALFVYVVARVLATTKTGRDLALYDARARWAAVVLAVAACTIVFHFFRARETPNLEMRFLRAGAATTVIMAVVIARTHAGFPTQSTSDEASSITAIVPQSMSSLVTASENVLSLGAGAALAALASATMLGETHPCTLFCAGFAAMLAFASWYADAVGYDRQKPRPGTGLGADNAPQGKRKVRDKEGHTLKVSVVGSRVVDDLYAQYRVRVEHEGLAWYVWRRFSQFDTLRHELRRMFGHGVLPQLPGKTWFSSLDEDFLQARVHELNAFMQALMDESLRRQVFKVAETRKFLGVGQGRGRTPEALAAAEAELSGPPKATAQEMAEFTKILQSANAAFEKAISVGEGDGWTFLKNYNGVQCYLKTERGLTHTKGVGTIRAPPLVAAAYMSDPAHRDDYDDLYKRSTPLRELDLASLRKAFDDAPIDICDVQHVEYKSPFPMVVTARDSVLITFRQIDKDGTVKVIMVSAPDALSPPSDKYVRAKVFSAGIKLEPHPTEPNASLMSNVQMIDPNGSIPSWVVKAVAPERAAMSAKIDACLSTLSSKPEPLPLPDLPHPHKD